MQSFDGAWSWYFVFPNFLGLCLSQVGDCNPEQGRLRAGGMSNPNQQRYHRAAAEKTNGPRPPLPARGEENGCHLQTPIPAAREGDSRGV